MPYKNMSSIKKDKEESSRPLSQPLSEGERGRNPSIVSTGESKKKAALFEDEEEEKKPVKKEKSKAAPAKSGGGKKGGEKRKASGDDDSFEVGSQIEWKFD
jgi:hypothetical protein